MIAMRLSRLKVTEVLVALATVLLLAACGSKKNVKSAEGTGAEMNGMVDDTSANSSAAGVDVVEDYLDAQFDAFSYIDNAGPRISGDLLTVTVPASAFFDLDSAMLNVTASSTLDPVVKVLLDYPQTSIVIGGHTGGSGDDGYNQKISERRARAIQTYLLGAGVDATRMEAVGYGSLRPIAPNDTEAGRAKNDRVEFEIEPSEDLLMDANTASEDE